MSAFRARGDILSGKYEGTVVGHSCEIVRIACAGDMILPPAVALPHSEPHRVVTREGTVEHPLTKRPSSPPRVNSYTNPRVARATVRAG